MPKYCMLCERHVEPKRSIGIGSWVLVLFTSGFWLFAFLLYPKRCPMCNGTAWGVPKTPK